MKNRKKYVTINMYENFEKYTEKGNVFFVKNPLTRKRAYIKIKKYIKDKTRRNLWTFFQS